ncbi:transcription elongation factor [Arundinibacter roseus]|uniref:Transcription elongation factor n=1 Tax=Arundinibacter roseus TaxID=2070510 RepID=A0A4R4K4E2_9BACT|nr:transcription elongation factor [Arundinibacter roseus]TDB61356.1 transcription elongation factor [Arundinibacter roseus]
MDEQNAIQLKNDLISHLLTILDARMAASRVAMQAAQESANDQSKSSAGDKYETSRSMGQLDRNMHARQFEQARQDRTILERLSTQLPVPAMRVVQGSLVLSATHYFFLAVGEGVVKVGDKTILAISVASPIGKLLYGRQVGETFLFQGKKSTVKAIY